MKLFSVFLFLFSSLSSSFAAIVPDFKVQVGLDPGAKVPRWLLLFTPPEKHHFNLEAPMKVASGEIAFNKAGAEPHKVGYQSSDTQLKEGSEVEASLFLCDDAKTFCLKKTVSFALKVNSDLKKLEFAPVAPVDSKPKVAPDSKGKPKGKKDEHAFWDNDPESAIAEALETKKPLLVDFYGIWCPPCNQFNEVVFSKAKFKAAAKNWVLLKMDADRTGSFALKSQLKIGGYPTIVALKVNSGKPDLTEIERVVGFYPLDEFVAKMKIAYENRNLSFAEQITAERARYSQLLKKQIELKIETKEKAEALVLAEEAARLNPDADFFTLAALQLSANDHPEKLKDAKGLALLKKVFDSRDQEDPETLLTLVDVLVSQADQFSKEQIAWANGALDLLAHRVSKETLSVPGVELSIADIDALRVDVAEALKDTDLTKASYLRTADSYEKIIQLQHNEESRGLNLEYAYYLAKSGKTDQAKKIYSHFIAKFPKEFTFYFAASRMYLDLKELKTAREYAEKAVQYSYDDNQLRSMERLVRIMAAQGEKQEAIKRGQALYEKAGGGLPDEFLNSVRTNRYRASLKKAMNEVEAGKI